MKRLHLIEIEDQTWCPQLIRSGVTDYLRFVLGATKYYAETAPVLAEALKKTGARRILDLCSGGGGPWPYLQPLLAELGVTVEVCLSDKYPNLEAFEHVSQRSDGSIRYHAESVDATRVPDELPGFRTMFTAFHHFPPEQAQAILADAISKRQGIAVFEATERHPVAMLLTISMPLHVLALTPFIRPFRWWRILWTYLIPVVPLVTLFDGLVSCLRVYSVEELHELTAGFEADGYTWRAGKLRGGRGPIPIIYLIGVPVENIASWDSGQTAPL